MQSVDVRPGAETFDRLVVIAQHVRVLVWTISPGHAVVPCGDRNGALSPEIAQTLDRFFEIAALRFQWHRVGGHCGHDHEVIWIVHFRAKGIVIPIRQVDDFLAGPAVLHRLAHALDEFRHDQGSAVHPIPAGLRNCFPAIGTAADDRLITR